MNVLKSQRLAIQPVVGMQALEAAIHAGSNVASGMDQIVQVAEQGSEITCEVCRCEWA